MLVSCQVVLRFPHLSAPSTTPFFAATILMPVISPSRTNVAIISGSVHSGSKSAINSTINNPITSTLSISASISLPRLDTRFILRAIYPSSQSVAAARMASRQFSVAAPSHDSKSSHTFSARKTSLERVMQLGRFIRKRMCSEQTAWIAKTVKTFHHPRQRNFRSQGIIFFLLPCA